MARTIEFTVPSERTDALLGELEQLKGIAGISLMRGASLHPRGDLVRILAATSDATRQALDLLGAHQIPADAVAMTAEPRAVLSHSEQPLLEQEGNETNWEEMAYLLRQHTNLSENYVALMFLSGALAALGILANTVHIVVGAMVIAPGFMPLVRLPFGFTGGPRDVSTRGLQSLLVGYAAMAAGAAVILPLARALDVPPAPFVELPLVAYWSTLQWEGVVVALLAGAAGIFVIASQREVLSAGVMIALALVPSASLAGMALVAGEWPLLGAALLRFGVEAAAVIASSTLVLAAKQWLVHRRRALG